MPDETRNTMYDSVAANLLVGRVADTTIFEAILLLARTESLVADPVYEG